jgi:pentatricopeptide repeat protein
MRQSTLALLAAHVAVGWVATAFLPQPLMSSVATISTSSNHHHSLFQQQQQQKPKRVGPCHNNGNRQVSSSHDIEEDKQKGAVTTKNYSNKHHQQESHEKTLWIFVHNLQRERREKGLLQQQQQQVQQQQNPKHHHHSDISNSQPHTRHPHPAKSLVSFLSTNQFVVDRQESSSEQPQPSLIPTTTSTKDAVEPFSRAVTQAIRLASELGDYKLIGSLLQASIHFANGYPIIMPRIFGEAIDGLAKTTANSNKIKQVWNQAVMASSSSSNKDTNLTTEPLGTFELNIMIKALASRGKIRPALDLYYASTGFNSSSSSSSTTTTTTITTSIADSDHVTLQSPRILPDPYTLSSIFTALQDSILDDQATTQQAQFRPAKQKTTITATTEQQGLRSQPASQCWQWNEAAHLLETYLVAQQQQQESSLPSLNNHVFSSLLKLNDRASQVYHLPSAHNGPKMALFLLHTMHQLTISPDVVTCTLIISNLKYQWKTALNMLYAMKTSSSSSSASLSWRLPQPNVYTYSAVISICAHCHQYQAAMELLQELKQQQHQQQDDDDRHANDCSPNTWVYNAALLATTRSDSLAVVVSSAEHTTPKNQKRCRERLVMAMKLLHEMQNSSKNCNPDTVTYNTVLATLDGIASSSMEQQLHSANDDELEQQLLPFLKLKSTTTTWNSTESLEENVLHRLLDEMESANIPRDSITYRNAILAVRFSQDTRSSVQRILDRAVLDKQALWASYSSPRQREIYHQPTSTKARQLDGKAADGVTFVFDTAMTVLSSRGDVDGVLSVFSQLMMQTATSTRQKPKANPDKILPAQVHLVHALGRSHAGAAIIPIFLNATRGDRIARLAVSKQYPTMDDKLLRYTPENEAVYSSAISACLVANDIESARAVLALMRAEGLKPSDFSLQEIARAYARLAVIEANKEINNPQGKTSNCSSLALTRATNAYSIAIKTLADPPASLLSTVARTCASLGMWTEASNVLKILHSRMTTEPVGSGDGVLTVLPGVHRALLRAVSIQGNVTAALSLVDNIQKLSKYMAKSDARQNEEEELLLYQSGNEASAQQQQPSVSARDNTRETLVMSVEDWKLVLIAASKSGHWRVCVSTLQFLRPFLEETHPSSLGSTVEERSRLYSHLAPALTIALKCLEIRSQYGWAVRTIDDWIDWCGRRPPREAVVAAIRILSKRGRGREVISLLARCTADDGALLSYANDDSNYGLILHVGAITALHKEGHYDDADDAFIAAVRCNFLPFDLQSEEFGDKRRVVLDLHGMNLPVAHSAVRVALQQEVHLASWRKPASALNASKSADAWDNDMIIVTGLGRNSALQMRPVLRPEVQRMLMEEFYPPLSTVSIPGNMGAVRIPYLDIRGWLYHQRREKGSRMLAVASVLRNVASIDRLRRSIALKIEAEKDRALPKSSEDDNSE